MPCKTHKTVGRRSWTARPSQQVGCNALQDAGDGWQALVDGKAFAAGGLQCPARRRRLLAGARGRHGLRHVHCGLTWLDWAGLGGLTWLDWAGLGGLTWLDWAGLGGLTSFTV